MTQDVYLLMDLLKQIDITSRALQMYPDQHPRVRQTVELLMCLVKRNMEGRENITFSIAEGSLFAEGQMIEKGNAVLDRLTRDWALRNIYHVTLQKGVSEEEFISFLRELLLKPQRLSDLGGIEKLLPERGVRNVLVNKLKYGIIDAEERYKSGWLDQQILPELLMAVQGALSGNADFDMAARNLEASLDETGIPDAGDILLRIFHMISENAPAVPEDSPDHSMKDRLVDLYRSFSPPLRRTLLRTAVLKRSTGEPRDTDKFYHSLSQEELDAAVLSLLDGSVAQEELRLFLENLIADPEALLSDQVLHRLKEKGLILDDSAIWEHLLARGNLEPEEIESLPGMLAKLIADGNLSAADRFSKLAFTTLIGGNSDQKLSAIRILPPMLVILSREDKWKNIQTSTSFLVGGCFRKETDAEVIAALLHYLFVSFRKCVAGGELQNAREILTAIRSRTEQDEAARNQLAERVMEVHGSFHEILRRSGDDVEVILECLRMCGPRGAEFILDLLAKEEDQMARLHLIQQAASLRSEDSLPVIQRYLSDPTWFIVRNMVTILNRMESKETRKLLIMAAMNPDSKVGMEIIKGLYRSSRSEDAPIIMQLLEHPDKAIRIRAANLCAALGIHQSIGVLQHLARSGTTQDTDLRTACLQAMLKMRALEALEPAILTLEKKSTKQEVSERNAAVRILGELKGGGYRTLLEHVSLTDINEETRTLAAHYLRRST